jgi:hypothetical protein
VLGAEGSGRTYRTSGRDRLIFIGVVGIITLAAPFAVADTVTHPGGALFDLVWLAILASFWWRILYQWVHTLRFLTGDTALEFQSFRRTRTVPVSQIRAVEARSLQQGIRFRFAEGSATVPFGVDGLHELLNRLQAANPSIELRGL